MTSGDVLEERALQGEANSRELQLDNVGETFFVTGTGQNVYIGNARVR